MSLSYGIRRCGSPAYDQKLISMERIFSNRQFLEKFVLKNMQSPINTIVKLAITHPSMADMKQELSKVVLKMQIVGERSPA